MHSSAAVFEGTGTILTILLVLLVLGIAALALCALFSEGIQDDGPARLDPGMDWKKFRQ